MVKRDVRLFLEDILEGISKIEEYRSGTTQKEFLQDHLVQDAVIRRLEIIGEATKNITRGFSSQLPGCTLATNRRSTRCADSWLFRGQPGAGMVGD